MTTNSMRMGEIGSKLGKVHARPRLGRVQVQVRGPNPLTKYPSGVNQVPDHGLGLGLGLGRGAAEALIITQISKTNV